MRLSSGAFHPEQWCFLVLAAMIGLPMNGHVWQVLKQSCYIWTVPSMAILTCIVLAVHEKGKDHIVQLIWWLLSFSAPFKLRFVSCFILYFKFVLKYYSRALNWTEIPPILIQQIDHMLDHIRASMVSKNSVRAQVLWKIVFACVTIITIAFALWYLTTAAIRIIWDINISVAV